MCAGCDWQSYLAAIAEIEVPEWKTRAQDTLDSIREWVEEHSHITPAQAAVIDRMAEE